ncbi:hypothetical protein ACFOZ1_15295 [Gracilibacillus marinus]|uniref:Uncharacterized protein n=1 Tax=Gracilibacillus marinus TaxID=630535 RepID=A0ABV8VZP1_9BACI
MIRYDGMPEEKPVVHEEIDEDDLIYFIIVNNKNRELTYNDVKAVLEAETKYLQDKGFIDTPER